MRDSSRGMSASNLRQVNSLISRAERAFRTAPPTLPLSTTRQVYAALSRISDPIKSCSLIPDDEFLLPGRIRHEGLRS